LAGKWVELLHEAAPQLKHAALLFNPQTASYVEPSWKAFQAAASSLSIQPIAARVHDVGELEGAIAELSRVPNGGLVVAAEIFATVHQQHIVELAAAHGLPAVYPFDFFARNGGLMSYGVDVDDLFRRAASYVDRILKGEKAGRPPGAGADEISAYREPENSEGVWFDHSGQIARDRRRGDRMKRYGTFVRAQAASPSLAPYRRSKRDTARAA
jgi:ABC-type uncharacterized transport system substrate-binding protein